MSIAGLHTESTAWLRFDGFEFTRTVNLYTDSSRIAVLNSTITEIDAHAINVRHGSSDILIAGNTIGTVKGTAINFSSSDTVPPISRVTIQGNHITGAGKDGMQLKNFRDVSIEGNEIEGVRRYEPMEHSDVLQTVYGGANLIVRANYIHDNAAGILLKDGAVKGALIENNLIVSNSGDGTGYSISIYGTERPQLVHNTVWNNRYGVILRSGTVEADIRNNILQGLARDSSGVDVAYEDYNLIATGAGRGAHDIAALPKFTAGYQLAAGSPGIDAADSDALVLLDRRGIVRIDDPSVANTGGGALRYYDMGAHERQF